MNARIRDLTLRARRAGMAPIAVTGAVVLLLWLATIALSDAPWLVVTAFWLVVAAIIGLWVYRDMRTDSAQFEAMARSLESALTRNTADVYDIRATAFAELEEVEDEGACYAFALEDGQLVFVTGQEFYESGRFPSLDFSLAHVLDEHGRTVDMVIEKRGPRAAPARRIPATVKATLQLPEHLELRDGRLEDLERDLAGPR